MCEEVFVVAGWKVGALVRPAGLFASERRVHDGLGHVEHEGQLQGGNPLSVEGPAVVVEAHIGETLLKLVQRASCPRQSVSCTVDAGALLHGILHLLTERHDALPAAGLLQ